MTYLPAPLSLARAPTLTTSKFTRAVAIICVAIDIYAGCTELDLRVKYEIRIARRGARLTSVRDQRPICRWIRISIPWRVRNEAANCQMPPTTRDWAGPRIRHIYAQKSRDGSRMADSEMACLGNYKSTPPCLTALNPTCLPISTSLLCTHYHYLHSPP